MLAGPTPPSAPRHAASSSSPDSSAGSPPGERVLRLDARGEQPTRSLSSPDMRCGLNSTSIRRWLHEIPPWKGFYVMQSFRHQGSFSSNSTWCHCQIVNCLLSLPPFSASGARDQLGTPLAAIMPATAHRGPLPRPEKLPSRPLRRPLRLRISDDVESGTQMLRTAAATESVHSSSVGTLDRQFSASRPIGRRQIGKQQVCLAPESLSDISASELLVLLRRVDRSSAWARTTACSSASLSTRRGTSVEPTPADAPAMCSLLASRDAVRSTSIASASSIAAIADRSATTAKSSRAFIAAIRSPRIRPRTPPRLICR